MAGLFNPTYNPAKVALGNSSSGPYMPTAPIASPVKGGNPIKPVAPIANPVNIGGTAQQSGKVLGSEAVRATGGAYDPAYNQDLATYAGGLFQRPGGTLSFNPTGPLSGNATGGGNAPVQGMPNTLIEQALGGQSFAYNPTPATPPTPSTANAPNNLANPQNWQSWLQGIMGQGGY
jgi:hypothetical protein